MLDVSSIQRIAYYSAKVCSHFERLPKSINSNFDMMSDCIFCRIASGEISSHKVYEDDDVLAFHDIHPQAPIHFLIIPKQHIASLAEADMNHQLVLGKMLAVSGRLAREQGATAGFRSIINTGRVGGQEVYHLHMHIFGGPQPLGRMLPKA